MTPAVQPSQKKIEFFNWRHHPVFLLVALAGLVVVAPYASNGTVVLLAIAFLNLEPLPLSVPRVYNLIRTPFGLFLAALVGWSFVTVFWAPEFMGSLFAWVRITLLFLLGFSILVIISRLDEDQLSVARRVLAFAGLIILGLFAGEIMTDGAVSSLLKGRPIFGMEPVSRGTAILAVIIWPVAVILARHMTRQFFKILLPLLAVGTAYFLCKELTFLASQLALMIGSVSFAFIYVFRRWALTLILGGFALIAVSAPVISLYVVNPAALQEMGVHLPEPQEHRLAIWSFVSDLTADAPIIGHGFDSSRWIGGNYVARLMAEHVEIPYTSGLLPLHPHNAVMQIWLELGLVGILCLLGMIFGLYRMLLSYQQDRLVLAAGGAMLVTFISIASISFGIWQNWWLATGWLGAATFFLAARKA
ncbi:MAG: O-antigen ligase family protein [Rhodospirillaceae bacterium]|nr:O-antigen ligase family protein [Rhodospirillaceae bacterium]MBT5373228.1 O-antigen ligase family protein [Rhodospirillaceae bacterium]MBT5660424.1 O-antigen ligase family protein [Rhodospirillaceae bacterium]MBT5752992.1 O-antigen ligase family protein [Rhodospirillaceae bacterium]